MRAMAGSEDDPDLFAKGLALFNAGRFYECHEAWEVVWKRAGGADKIFYQGLIQAAVALLHAQRGNRRGAESTYKKARTKLSAFPMIHRGIALGEFRDALAKFFAETTSQNVSRSPPLIRRVQ